MDIKEALESIKDKELRRLCASLYSKAMAKKYHKAGKYLERSSNDEQV